MNFKTLRNGLWAGLLAATLVACSAAVSNDANTPTESATAQPTADSGVAVSVANTTKLNLNTATADQFLAAIPGLPQRMTREFDEYRPYVSIEQFRREIGKYVDDAQVAEWEKYVYVPIEVNSADESTLQQLPGVESSVAAQLVAARPFASNAAFLAKLAELVPGVDTATAATYLVTP